MMYILYILYVCMYVEWLLEKWVTYERTVSELLDWVMTEAERFAKEVTTRGDKGVVDHIKSCEVSTHTVCLCISAVHFY